MVSTLIAVAGTLLGAVVAGLLQHRTARTAREGERDDARRDKELEAAVAFTAAVAAHRRAMAVREDLRLTGAGADRVAAARAESHATRSSIEGPKALVSILVPALAPAAEDAARAAYALRGAVDLDARRESAIEAADRFMATAAQRFA
ncbi:protein kilB [Streptomyces pinistramenti]|uniref:protein kilB n=1 Tax=Streptomyces pinistramenti TaxID=2884812 RepID=UPI001D090481|nr:protein kilB [Streptomyces pinistramenti]MCB5910353.1 protein kilB [Streptomyces pinistramenti]